MEIALGISMTPTTVHMVLVEGDKADGLIMECDQFSMIAGAGTLAASAPEQVSAAVLATQQSASRQGHNLSMCGIAASDACDMAGLRESLAARGLGDVIPVSESQSVAALAHTVARAIGYTDTALLFVKEREATLSVLASADRSVVEVARRSLDDADITSVLTELVTGFSQDDPQGLFVVDSSGRIADIKPCLEAATSLPIIFPEEPVWALARGAALAAAAVPRFEASTVGLAYAQDPDDEDFDESVETATGALVRGDEATRRGFINVIRWGTADPDGSVRRSGGRFVPVGSVAASVVVIGAVAVVMALAASTAPTSTEPVIERGRIAASEPVSVAPSAPPAMAAPAPKPLSAPPPPVAAPPPPPPAPVVVQKVPRTVAAQAPAVRPRVVEPVAAAQAPSPAPVVAPPPPEMAVAPRDPQPEVAPIPPAAAELPIPAPAPAVPVPPPLPQITLMPPAAQAPATAPQAPFLRWLPSFLRPPQQAPVQQYTPPVQQWTPPVQQYTPPVQQYAPPVQQWTPPVQQWTPPVQRWTPPVQQWTPPVQQAPLWPQSPWRSRGPWG